MLRLLTLVCLWVSASAFVLPQQRTVGFVAKVPSGPAAPMPPASSSSTQLFESKEGGGSSLPFWLDPGTKGGAVVLTIVLFVVPLIVYNVLVGLGYDEIQTGQTIGIGFTILATLGWVSTYLFRVVTKDMTYVSVVSSSG